MMLKQATKTEEDWKAFWEKLKQIYISHDGNDENYYLEFPVLEGVFKRIEKDISYSFSILDPLERGGAAIICSIDDFRLDTKRAMKVPRPTDLLMETVANESSYLSTIRHQNIVSIYALGDVARTDDDADESKYPYFIMDYIEGGAPDLLKQLKLELEEAQNVNHFDEILLWLAKIFLSVGTAIAVLHADEIIHFDIKPENILIDSNKQPVISDLGWAKKISESQEIVTVGFTRFYAHPDLKDQVKHASSENRAKGGIAPERFRKEWDIYALGKTVLELLFYINQKFPENSAYNFNFKYLHLSACRMLDGRNYERSQTKTYMDQEKKNLAGHKSYYETCLDLQVKDFRRVNLGYAAIDDFVYDLEKLVGDVNLLDEVPELNHYHPGRIQATVNESLSFSKRVGSIIDQPVYCRLKNVQQLGFTSNVYPTATHTRFEHSLGVYGNVLEYIKSLYNDKYNPIFRQLVKKEDLELLLITSLLHDLGHYPLAHDIEELGIGVCSHEYWTKNLLKKLDIQGWNVSIDDVEKLLEARKTQTTFAFKPNIKIKMLGSLLNGAIDCDKIDYLMRDSHECCLKYGSIVDKDRLIRGLTIVVTKETDGDSDFDIGVYNQAYTAAQALSFARYMMYHTVYWHRTVRAFRIMLKLAFKQAFASKTRSIKKKKVKFISQFEKLVGAEAGDVLFSRESLLNLISQWAGPSGKILVDLIKKRIPYKRILTVYNDRIKIGATERSLQHYRNHIEKPEFVEKIKEELLNQVKHYYENIAEDARRQTTIFSFDPNEIVEKLNEDLSIIIDFPEPSEGTKRPLRIMIEPSYEKRNLNMVNDIQNSMSRRWSELHVGLMDMAAKCRVYCRPDIRDGVLLAVPPDKVKEIFDKKLQEMAG